MFRVATSHLVAGQKVARHVTDASGRILLAAGTILKESYIEYLKQYGIPAVYIGNELAPDLEVPEVVSERARAGLSAQLKAAMGHLKESLADKGKAGVKRWAGDAARLRSAVSMVVDEILANPRALVHLQDIRQHDEYTLGHSVNVCILSTLTAHTMGLDVGKVREIGMGAVLHDIGKVTIADEILNKPGPLTASETEEMRQHTTRGFEILRKQSELSFHVAHVAYQHHERWGGGGYPRGLSGKDIHAYARVVTLADVYDAMTADRVYRKGYTPDRALRNLLEVIPDWFEPEVLKAFVENIALFPIGSVLEMNSGEVAVVTAVVRGSTDRPRVRVVKDAAGRTLSQPFEVDLATEPSYKVTKVLGNISEEALESQLRSAGED